MKVSQKWKAATTAAASARNDLQNAVEEIRGEISRLVDERNAIERAPKSEAETKAAVKEHLDQLERDALTRLIPSQFSSPNGRPDADQVFRITGGGAIGLQTFFEGVGALCALGLRSQIETALIGHALSEMSGPGISEAERAAELSRIEKAYEAASCAEEGLIRDAESAGMTIHRRADADPAIYLAKEV